MEEQTVLLSDIERNKELFEYEMTEVLRQLKGTFTKERIAVPGLDGLAVPEVRVQAEIPAVNMQPVTLPAESIAVPKIGAPAPMPEIRVEAAAVHVPEIPKVGSVEIRPVETVQKPVIMPEIPVIRPVGIRPVETVQKPVSVPEAPVVRLVDIRPVETEPKPVSVPEVPVVRLVDIRPVKTEPKPVSVPEVPVVRPVEIRPVKTEQKPVIMPEIPAVKAVRMPEVSVPAVHIGEIPAPVSIPAFMPAEAAPVKVPAVQVPDAVRADFRADQIRVSGEVSVREIPVPEVKPFVPQAVSFTAQNPVQTDIPQITRIQPVSVKPVRLPEMQIPEITVPSVPEFKPAQIRVKPFRMSVDLASLPGVPERIPQIEIPKLQFRVPDDFPDPVLPDFSAEIRGILDAAANEI